MSLISLCSYFSPIRPHSTSTLNKDIHCASWLVYIYFTWTLNRNASCQASIHRHIDEFEMYGICGIFSNTFFGTWLFDVRADDFAFNDRIDTCVGYLKKHRLIRLFVFKKKKCLLRVFDGTSFLYIWVGISFFAFWFAHWHAIYYKGVLLFEKLA